MLTAIILISALCIVAVFVGGVIFGRRHQTKIEAAIRKAERLKEVAEE